LNYIGSSFIVQQGVVIIKSAVQFEIGLGVDFGRSKLAQLPVPTVN